MRVVVQPASRFFEPIKQSAKSARFFLYSAKAFLMMYLVRYLSLTTVVMLGRYPILLEEMGKEFTFKKWLDCDCMCKPCHV